MSKKSQISNCSGFGNSDWRNSVKIVTNCCTTLSGKTSQKLSLPMKIDSSVISEKVDSVSESGLVLSSCVFNDNDSSDYSVSEAPSLTPAPLVSWSDDDIPQQYPNKWCIRSRSFGEYGVENVENTERGFSDVCNLESSQLGIQRSSFIETNRLKKVSTKRCVSGEEWSMCNDGFESRVNAHNCNENRNIVSTPLMVHVKPSCDNEPAGGNLDLIQSGPPRVNGLQCLCVRNGSTGSNKVSDVDSAPSTHNFNANSISKADDANDLHHVCLWDGSYHESAPSNPNKNLHCTKTISIVRGSELSKVGTFGTLKFPDKFSPRLYVTKPSDAVTTTPLYNRGVSGIQMQAGFSLNSQQVRNVPSRCVPPHQVRF